LKRIYEALTLAQGLSHPFSLAHALACTTVFHLLCRERQAVQEWTERTIAFSTEQGFPFWLAEGTIYRGWVLIAQEREEEGVVQIRQGLAARQAIESKIGRPSSLALLAEACGKVGQVKEGLGVLAEALAFVDKMGQRAHEAELYRLKGMLTLQKFGVRVSESDKENQKSKVKGQKSKVPSTQSLTPNTQVEVEAEACFLKAIEIAQKQQAKSLELRAVMSLSRLWQSQGKKKEAHDLLFDIYYWFTQGFDTKDLQEAKALLEELA
jgi:predicted ATPase